MRAYAESFLGQPVTGLWTDAWRSSSWHSLGRHCDSDGSVARARLHSLPGLLWLHCRIPDDSDQDQVLISQLGSTTLSLGAC